LRYSVAKLEKMTDFWYSGGNFRAFEKSGNQPDVTSGHVRVRLQWNAV